MQRILSGIQPTNKLQLGNYLGAIRNWVSLQDDYENLYCIVDLHAITVPQDPASLRANAREMAAAYVASGIDPEKGTIFIQSAVPAHAQLGWILGCFTPLGWLNRMTQFKDKAGKDRESVSLGLYGYPTLMAADILLYDTNLVPVGEDQKQHVELTRDIAQAMHHRFGQEIFTIPEPFIQGEGTRVMSLRDGTKKMSKSDPSDYSRINLTDDAETIAQKIRKAKTDALPFPDSLADLDARPEARNLAKIYAALADTKPEAVIAEFGGQTFSIFKNRLADLAVEKLSPIASRMKDLQADPGELDNLLARGAARANELAEVTLARVKYVVGF